VRLLVSRARSRPRQPGVAEVALDVALRARPPDAMLERRAGIDLPPLPP
jgi:hypothetical protein